jgi:hypothetical protein
MKLSNERIINDASRLGELSQKPLPIKVSYAIAKNITRIDSELKVYNSERQKLIEKYAEKDDKGKVATDETGQFKLKPQCIDEWNTDIKELLAIENEISIHKFKLSELDGHSMKPAELMLIEYMIEE